MYRLISVVFGYFVGCINFAYLIGRFKEHIDIRDYGSGNSGTTNAIRVMGWRLGLVTFLGDLLKCIAAYAIAYYVSGGDSIMALYAGVGVIFGHNWPVFLKFKGGKGIASNLGLIYAVDFRAGLIANIIMAVIIAATRYVSLSSIVMAILMPILFYIFRDGQIEFVAVGIVLMGMAIFRHRSNIKRLYHGTENKVGKRLE